MCLQGSLRVAIDSGMLEDRLSRRPDYLTVLTLALVSRVDCNVRAMRRSRRCVS